MRYYLLFFTIVSFYTSFSQIGNHSKTITFFAKDSVLITADTYFSNDIEPTILLCHQAGFSRGEYIETAKKINKLGFSCMAIDQRSGREVNGIINQTAIDADSKFMNVGYAGAKRDLEAAIDYLFELNGNMPIILVGSSYSASLALWLGVENKKIKAVAAFSPGEYLKNMKLADIIKQLQIPTFVTSSKREIEPVEELIRFVKPKYITHFKPDVEGIHGSRAIWDSTEGYEAYWSAFKEFLIHNK